MWFVIALLFAGLCGLAICRALWVHQTYLEQMGSRLTRVEEKIGELEHEVWLQGVISTSVPDNDAHWGVAVTKDLVDGPEGLCHSLDHGLEAR